MPYRPLFADIRLERGWCPWCRAEIELDRSTASSVCPACNARYAPAFATTPPRAPAVALVPDPRVMRVLGVIDVLIRIPAIVFIGGLALMAVGLVTAICVVGGVSPNRRTRAWLTSAFPELRSGHRERSTHATWGDTRVVASSMPIAGASHLPNGGCIRDRVAGFNAQACARVA